MSEVEERRVAVDGLDLFVRVHGSDTGAVPVLCLPGLTRNSRDFEDVAADLATDRLVVTFDFRGRGFSDHDPTGASYTPDVYAADAVAVLDAVGIERACLVGTSLGGAVAVLAAVLHPDRVAGVLLNDVGPKLEPAGFRRIQGYAGKFASAREWPEMIAALRRVAGETAPDLTDAQWEVLARQQCRVLDDGLIRPDHDPLVVAGIDEVDPEELDDTWALFDALGDVPVVVVRGALSDLLSEDTVVEMKRRRPDLHAVTVPDRGHAPTLVEPEARAAIAELLTMATHLDAAALRAGLDEIRGAPADGGTLEMIVARPAVGERLVLDEATLDLRVGLVGDTWADRPSSRTDDKSPHPDMQLNIMNARAAALVAGNRRRWSLAGDQLYLDLDLGGENLPPGSRLSIGEAVIEVTDQPHTGCAKFRRRFGAEALRFVNSPEGKELNLRGINAKVVVAGVVRRGDAVSKVS